MTITDIQVLYSRARDLARRGRRSVLGIVGPPGGGKSTLAQTVVAELGDAAALVPMDGFHLAQSELVRLGRRNRMGAPDTFDAGGYATLLRRLRNRDETVVYAPEFRRDIEEPIAVPRSIPLVITEGNYLLLETGDWAAVRPLLDETWYVEMDENTRVRWLVQRHIDYGKSPQAARSWVLRSDQANAKLIAATRNRADIIVQRATTPPIGQ
jgi:pantothenate kinase